jgi:23S rRNA (cytosine1962-C5)-methyltransferase
MPFLSEKDKRQAEYLSNRLVRNEKALRRWARNEGVEALRLYDADIPEIPLAVERYGRGADAACVLWLYERPYEKDETEESAWLDLMAKATAAALSISPDLVYVKTRKKMRGREQYEKKSREARDLVVKEAGLSFRVNLSDYLDTGLFLDHRPARAAIGRSSRGKRVLNLFSYTGAFSVHAAAGGSARVLSVDLSNTYLDWARENFELNGLPASAHEELRADCVAFLEGGKGGCGLWDLIVCDPPTFSNSSMARADFDLLRDWPRLLDSCSKILAPGGTILFSTNARRLKLDPAAQILPCVEVGEASVPRDFRDRKIHRCWLLGERTGIVFT